MKIVEVKSTNIKALGYEENRKLTLSSKGVDVLRIYYNNGRIYDYYAVPKDVFENFLKAESKGKYFWQNIDKKYEFEKVNQ